MKQTLIFLALSVIEKEVSSRAYNLPDSLTYQVIEIITGSKTNADLMLVLEIPSEITVKWQAVYQSGVSFYALALIRFSGNGIFEVAGGAPATGENQHKNHFTFTIRSLLRKNLHRSRNGCEESGETISYKSNPSENNKITILGRKKITLFNTTKF